MIEDKEGQVSAIKLVRGVMELDSANYCYGSFQKRSILPSPQKKEEGRQVKGVTLCEKTTVVRVRCTEKWRERERSYFQFPLCGVEIFS